jgi:hypothetical protein
MALTRILSGASSSANPLVNVSMASSWMRRAGSCHRMGADDGAEIDDAPALGTEALDRLLHHENRPEHVDVVVNVEALLGDLRESTEAEDPGVVEQNVEPSEGSVDFFEQPRNSAALDTSALIAIASPPLPMLASTAAASP